MYSIYLLGCPKTNIIRYVGVTNRGHKIRIKEHYKPSRKSRNPYKWNWLQKLKREGLEPNVYFFCSNLTQTEAFTIEKALIKSFKEIYGKRLTNISDGPRPNPSCSPVVQYDKNGRFIKKYSSIAEAAKVTSSKYRSISKCCRGKVRHHNNFKWRYA